MPSNNDELPFYRHIVTDAWSIAKDHRHLWLFGFFATFLGFGGIAELLLKGYENRVDMVPELIATGGTPLDLIPGFATMSTIIRYSENPVLSTTFFMALCAALMALLAWVVTVSLGALIGSVKKIVRGGEPVFADGLKIGAAKFWPVFGINVSAKAVTVLCIVANSIVLFLLLPEKSWLNGILYVLSSLVLAAVAITTSLLAVYASNFAVIKDEPFGRALARSWKLLSKHWLVSAEMVGVVFLVNMVIAVTAAICVLVLSVPVIFLFLVAVAAKKVSLILGLTAVSGILVMAVAVVLGSFLTTMQVSAWTLFWEELVEGKPTSKLHRLVHWFKRR